MLGRAGGDIPLTEDDNDSSRGSNLCVPAQKSQCLGEPVAAAIKLRRGDAEQRRQHTRL